MKLTKKPTGKQTHKTHKLTFWKSEENLTGKQTHQTHKLTKNLTENKLTKLTRKMKLTQNKTAQRRRISIISNYIRYCVFSCEFVSLGSIATCEENEKASIVQYNKEWGETHKTHKLTPHPEAV